MSSHSKRIGDIGENSIIAKLLTYEQLVISRPVTDNEPYDIIVDCNNKLYRVQIKTTEFVKDGKMQFSTGITNPFKRTNKMYSSSEIDMFMLYCVENNYFGLLLMSEYTSKSITIRVDLPLSNNFTNVKMADDYSLDSRLSELITTGSISNKLLSREDAIFLTQEHTKLNDGKASQKLLDSRLSTRKVIRPATYEDFKQEMEELGWNYSAMGRKYGVSDNAVRKWERFYLKYNL